MGFNGPSPPLLRLRRSGEAVFDQTADPDFRAASIGRPAASRISARPMICERAREPKSGIRRFAMTILDERDFAGRELFIPQPAMDGPR
jgi:hypothetical protein